MEKSEMANIQVDIVSAKANLREAQVKRSSRSQNVQRAVLRAAEQVQDGLDGEI
jgi:hypothetical protein